MSKTKNNKIATSTLSIGAISALIAGTVAMPAFAATDVTGTWGNASYAFNESTGNLTIGTTTATDIQKLGYIAEAPWNDASDEEGQTPSIEGWKIQKVTFVQDPRVELDFDSANLFNGLRNLKSFTNINSVKTDKLVNMEGMFQGTAIKALDLSKWDTESLKFLGSAFKDMQFLRTLNVNWDTTRVVNTNYTFSNLPNLEELDLSKWDTTTMANAEETKGMVGMFEGTNNLKSLTLGKNTKLVNFKDEKNTVKLVNPPANNKYTGKWTNEKGWTGTAEELIIRSQDTATAAGTYVWEVKKDVVPEDLYDISYNLNGGEGIFTMESLPEGANLELPSIVPVKDGYTFDGWMYDGIVYASGDNFIVPANNVDFVAQWTEIITNPEAETFAITFTNGGDNWTDLVINVEEDGELVFPEPMAKEGYTFDGWAVSTLRKATVYEPNTVYPEAITADMTFVGTWTEVVTVEENVVVSFDLNGGKGTFSNIEGLEGDAIKLPTGIPTKDGFNFTGWLYDETTYKAGAEFVIPATNTVLVAQWEEKAEVVNPPTNNINYELTFNLNGGKGTFGVITAKEGEKVSLPTAIPTKEGYKFTGWKFGKETKLFQAKSIFTMPGENTELVAQWEKPSDTKATKDLEKTGGNTNLGWILGATFLLAGGITVAVTTVRKKATINN